MLEWKKVELEVLLELLDLVGLEEEELFVKVLFWHPLLQ